MVIYIQQGRSWRMKLRRRRRRQPEFEGCCCCSWARCSGATRSGEQRKAIHATFSRNAKKRKKELRKDQRIKKGSHGTQSLEGGEVGSLLNASPTPERHIGIRLLRSRSVSAFGVAVSRLQSWRTPARVEGGNCEFETRVEVPIGTWRKRASSHGFGCCWSRLARGVFRQSIFRTTSRRC